MSQNPLRKDENVSKSHEQSPRIKNDNIGMNASTGGSAAARAPQWKTADVALKNIERDTGKAIEFIDLKINS